MCCWLHSFNTYAMTIGECVFGARCLGACSIVQTVMVLSWPLRLNIPNQQVNLKQVLLPWALPCFKISLRRQADVSDLDALDTKQENESKSPNPEPAERGSESLDQVLADTTVSYPEQNKRERVSQPVKGFQRHMRQDEPICEQEAKKAWLVVWPVWSSQPVPTPPKHQSMFSCPTRGHAERSRLESIVPTDGFDTTCGFGRCSMIDGNRASTCKMTSLESLSDLFRDDSLASS